VESPRRGREPAIGLPVLRRRIDHDHVGAVHLLQENDRHTQLGCEAGAVGGDRRGVVADACREVERAEGTARPPACTGADDPPDARHPQRRPRQETLLLNAS
jgi:hypothetical protein